MSGRAVGSTLRQEEILQDDPEEVFEMVDVIGEGAYGLICTCKNIKQNKIYAIKFLEIEEEDEEHLQKEIDILKEAGECKNTVKYFGCYIKDSTLMIVMEFCDGGSCLDIMNANGKKTLEEAAISAICAAMVQGLIFLHSHKILHRDLKAGNVLLTSDGVVKLADFGVSAKLMFTHQKKDTVVGSPYWMAPEVISVQKEKAEGYDFKADIWSMAITAIELAEGKPPHFEIASLRVIFLIPTKDPPVLKDRGKWSTEFHDFLAVCLKKSPKERPSAVDLLQHPFIKRGLQGQDVIKNLVQSSMPALLKARADKKKKEKDDESDDEESRSLPRTITINTRSGEVTMSTEGGSYGTTVINTEGEE
eukprot:TRINITY_DN19535_c0_g1_i1.p1 TRINITY_DN19535_c0_g1~~TRINITY_DN19535_c0_g1_i1.p1  ORF type:complete len:362 (-),score=109.35 TRINITY_DN19535_c0_g1_i1:81-1166(-)